MMACGVGTDPESGGNGRVGSALGKQIRDFCFPGREVVLALEVRKAATPWAGTPAAYQAPVLLELLPEFTHLIQRHPNLIDQDLAILPENCKGRQQVLETIRRLRCRSVLRSFGTLGPLHGNLEPVLLCPHRG
jgi:hypothetical protein